MLSIVFNVHLHACLQCLETLASRQMDMQLFVADGCKEALLEEKRRFCFLVDKHCILSYQFASFHDKVDKVLLLLCWKQSNSSHIILLVQPEEFIPKPTISRVSMYHVAIVIEMLHSFY